MSVPAPLEAGIKHLPASYSDRPDMTLPPALMPVAPASPKTPALIKVAAIAGILSTLTGVAILVYFLVFDRPAKQVVQPTLKKLAMAGSGTGAAPVAPTKLAASPDAGAVKLEFPPVDVKHTTGGRRPRRVIPGRTKVAKRPKPGKKLTAAQRRLLDQMGDTKLPASGVPKAHKGRRRSRPSRQITGAEIGSLQRRNKFALKACYQRSLKRDDSLKELKAVIQVKVGTSGKVISVSVGGVSDFALRSCLKRSIKRWIFKPIGGSSSQTVEFPLIFRGS